MMYPLAEFDGNMKSINWNTIAKLPNAATGDQEVKWVPPESFVDTLPAVLADAPPLPGEEARYSQLFAVLEAAKNDPKIKAAMTQAAADADEQLIKPLPKLGSTASLPLEHNFQRSCLRRRLFHSHCGGEIQHPRQFAE